MISVDEALSRVIAAVVPLPAESVAIGAALGRILTAPCHSAHALPLFTQSAVDGYAIRYADLLDLPCRLPLLQHIAAAAQPQQPVLAPGTAARILTGGLLPLGADTVVRQELTHRERDAVTVLSSVAPGTDIRMQGEEVAAGAVIAEAGQRVTPGLIGACALAGIHAVQVRRLPRIVVLVSGDEVVSGEGALQLGQVPDANGPLLAAYLSQWGCPPLRIENMADHPEAVRTAMARAYADADLVLTSGGASVGDHDYIPATAEALGARCLLWKVAQKPGMPLFVAQRDGVLLFGLPGNPASVLVNLLVYVRAALDAMSGLNPQQRWRFADAPISLKREPDKTFWLRAVLRHDDDGRPRIEPLPGQASHMLGNLAQADVLARVAGGTDALPLLPYLGLNEH